MLCSSVGRRLLRCPLLSLSFRCRMSSSPTKAAAHVRFSQQTSDDAASDASLQDRVTEALILHARESSSSSPASPQPVPLSGNVRQVSDGDGDDEVEPAEAIYAVLNALLSANHNTAHIEYNQYLSNHLPHALISLWRLGASSRRLLAYVAFYSTRLEPSREQQSDYPSANGEEEARLEAASRQQPAHQDSAPPDHGDSSSRNSEQRSSQRDKSKAQLVHTIDEKSWRYYLGHRKHFDAYFNFFDAQLHTLIAQHSSTTTNNTTAAEKAQQPAIGALSVAERSAVSILLSRYMPTLLPGGSHSALHPIIHVGWALSCGRAGLSTLCEGLAYMCYSFHSLDNSCGSDYSSAALLAVDGANSQSLFATLQSTVSACREQRLLTAMGESVLRVPYCEMQVGIFQRKLVWLSIHQAQLLHRLSCLPQLPSAPASTLESVLSSLFLHTMFLFAISNDDFFVLHCLTSLYAFSQLLPLLPSDYQPIALRYALKFASATWIAQGLPGVEHEAWRSSSSSMGGGDIQRAVHSLLQHARQGERAGDSSNTTRRLYAEVGWDELRSAGRESDDEHTQKLVHVCWERSECSAQSTERQLAHFVAWKRLTDEDLSLFTRTG